MPLKIAGGAYTALVTPFREGRVDYPALGRLIEDQIAGGIDGLVPCGTTGESPTLTPEEHLAVVAFTVKRVRGRVPVVAGSGSNSTAEAVEYTRHARKVGADAALLVTPYYNKPNARGLEAHFSTVADAVDLPQVLYNIPGRSVVNLSPETVASLSRHPRIVGIKEASGNLEQMARVRRLCGPDFLLFSGDDLLTLPVLSLGGHGVVSVVSHLIPGDIAAMVRLYRQGRLAEARALFEKHFDLCRTVLGVDTNPVGVKTALALQGRIREEFRLPLLPASPEARVRVRKVLQNADLLARGRRKRKT